MAMALHFEAAASYKDWPAADLREFATELKSHSKDINTISCRFSQVRSMSILAEEVKSEGSFYYKRENNICLEFDQPQGDKIVMAGGRFMIVTMGKVSTVPMGANPMLKQLNGVFAACMSGDLTAIEAWADLECFAKASSYMLVITPRDKKARKYVDKICLKFNKTDRMSIEQMRVDEPGGDYTEYRFLSKTFNGVVDDAKFAM